jgi:hypothetical protein
MNFKTVTNESQIQLGIDRLSRKLYRSRTEQVKLEELELNLAVIAKEKKILKNQFASTIKNKNVFGQANLSVFKNIVNQLRIENSEKRKRISMISKSKITKNIRLSVRETPNIDWLNTCNISNSDKISSLERMLGIEENDYQSLEMVRRRLESDVILVKQKAEHFQIYQSLSDHNLARISQTIINGRFKKVK